MSSSLKLVTLALLSVSCLPDPDPGSYYFSKTVLVTDTEVPTYETKRPDKGWKVIQRRADYGEPRENFDRNWNDYKQGFGSTMGEFWLGNENIHQLTKSGDMKLRIELEAHNGTTAWAEYYTFRVEGEDQAYRLQIGEYSGTAGDSMTGNNGLNFTTQDRDNGPYSTHNCAKFMYGGWWFNRCGSSHLNGIYYTDPKSAPDIWRGIKWWDNFGREVSLKSSTMMIKKKTAVPAPPSTAVPATGIDEEFKCLKKGGMFLGNKLKDISNVSSWADCQEKCHQASKCAAWTLNTNINSSCYLLTNFESEVENEDFLSGFRNCTESSSIKPKRLTNFVNNWDGHLKYQCPKGHHLSHMYSEHNSRHEDRRFKFDCKAGDVTTSCSWTGILNGYDGVMNFNCPNGGVISGFESWHNSHHEDRQWKSYCCTPKVNPSESIETGWINDWDGVMDYRVDNGWFIQGAYSEHNSRREDRIWKLRLAKISQPVTCEIRRIEIIGQIQPTYLGTKVVGSDSNEICQTGQEMTIGIESVQTLTDTISLSKSSSTTAHLNFGLKMGIKISAGLEGVGSVEENFEYSANWGESYTDTFESSRTHTISQSVIQKGNKRITGPQGVLLVAIIDEYEYDNQDVPVKLHLTCSDGNNNIKYDRIKIKKHNFNNFHIEPILSRSDLTEGQCNAQPPECIRRVVRNGDFLTNLDEIKKKFARCYENVESGAEVITTSNWPRPYPNGEDKQWPIVARVGQHIIFEFTAFSIEASSSCKYDWVRVIDGNGQELLKKSCGDKKPKSFISKTNKATVIFHSDGSKNTQGFRLEYAIKGTPHTTGTPTTEAPTTTTVIQRRGDFGEPREDFIRNWNDYKQGFGDKNKEFWLGNDQIHQLTKAGDMKLRVELEAHDGRTAWAEYDTFRVEGEDQGYLLHIGKYSGTAGDSMTGSRTNNGMKFTTQDRDNDKHGSGNCAKQSQGGWWFSSCGYSRLNGVYYTGPKAPTQWEGIKWGTWLGWSDSLKATTMMIIKKKTINNEPSTLKTACHLGWTYLEHTGKCYKHDPTKRSWTEAYGSCRSSSPSSTLSSVHDKTTNDFLTTLSGGSKWTWLGGYQDDKENWHWADGSKWTWYGYNNWGRGQPDNAGKHEHHLGLNFPGRGLWNDFNDTLHPQGSICQYDPGCFDLGLDYAYADLSGGRKYGITSPEKCQKLCQETNGCRYFTWHNANSHSCCRNNCFLKYAAGTKKIKNPAVTSGPRDCGSVVSSDEDNFSAGDEEFFSPDLEEPQSTCSSNADCPSHLACIRSLLSSDPGTCGDPWCGREEWNCGSGARCIIVNHHPLCQGTDE